MPPSNYNTKLRTMVLLNGRGRYLWLVIFLFANQRLLVSQKISIDECYQWATLNSPLENQINLIEKAKMYALRNANLGYLPQASLSGQFTWQSEVTGIPFALPNVEIPKISKDQYKATIDVSQNIWDGGYIHSQKQITIAAAKVEVEGVETSLYQLKEQITNYYFSALLAQKQFDNITVAKKEIERQLSRQKANLENGTTIKSNIMSLEARLIEMGQTQREIRSKKISALKALSILTGKEISGDAELNAPNEAVSVNAPIDRPELRQLDAQKQLIEANKYGINARYSPKLNLFATGGYGRPALNFLSPDFSPYFIGGAVIKIPLSHLYSGLHSNDKTIQDIQKEKIENQKNLFIQQLQVKIEAQKEDMSRIQDQIKEDMRIIEIRGYIKSNAEVKLNNGVITVNEYITEVDNETKAKQNLDLHKIQLQQTIQAIKITLGDK